MQLTISEMFCSLRSASASAVQAWAQSDRASMAPAKRSASRLKSPG
jgi:hypothetical protein